MSLYRNILKQAVKITWRHKYLWFLGLFASLIGSNVGDQILVYGLDGSVSKNLFVTISRFKSTGIFNFNIFIFIEQLFKNDPIATLILLLITLIILILFVLIIWLAIISQIGLVKNSAQIISPRNKQSEVYGIKNNAINGMQHFWSVLGINLVSKIMVFFILFLSSLPILIGMISKTGVSQSLKFNLLCIILFTLCSVAAIIISFIAKYAIAYIVLKQAALIKSIKQAFGLFISNWLISVEMAFILFFINFMAGVSIMFIMFLLFGSFFFTSMFAGSGWIMLIGIFLLLFIIIIFGSALTTFQITAWTNLFIKITNNRSKNLSKIVRIFSRSNNMQ